MDQLDTLKTKYAGAIKTIIENGTHLTNLHLHEGKLVIKGASPSEQAKNEVWTAIKAADAKYGDVQVELGIDPSLPIPDKTYTVQAGDTLGKLAKEFLGNAGAYMKIFDANKDQLKDPNMIKVGQVLRIPKA
jgi:nucleoid-associated protein YgaU